MLILVRHGRTQANASGLFQGRRDLPLDDYGRTQAQALGAVLPKIDEVVCSPLRRARETAEAIGGNVSVDERWIELDYGAWEGLPVSDLTSEHWRTWRGDPTFRPPGGESHAEVSARVDSAYLELVEKAAVRNIVVVSHVSPIKAAVSLALGGSEDLVWKLVLSTASISRLVPRSGQMALLSFNETGHLPET